MVCIRSSLSGMGHVNDVAGVIPAWNVSGVVVIVIATCALILGIANVRVIDAEKGDVANALVMAIAAGNEDVAYWWGGVEGRVDYAG